MGPWIFRMNTLLAAEKALPVSPRQIYSQRARVSVESIVELKNLRVEYRAQNSGPGKKVAIKDLSLRVHAGEVFGFLGPNGAGKTTTMNVLLGFVNATRGA